MSLNFVCDSQRHFTALFLHQFFVVKGVNLVWAKHSCKRLPFHLLILSYSKLHFFSLADEIFLVILFCYFNLLTWEATNSICWPLASVPFTDLSSSRALCSIFEFCPNKENIIWLNLITQGLVTLFKLQMEELYLSPKHPAAYEITTWTGDLGPKFTTLDSQNSKA